MVVCYLNVFYFCITLTILIIVVVLCTLNIGNKDNFVSQTAYDGRRYNVRAEGNSEERIESANFLSNIYNKIDKLVLYMKDKSLPNNTTAIRLYKRWARCGLKETSYHETSAAYTVNKGEELRLCIRSPKSQLLENENTAIFVVLHELAHLMSVSYGHNEEFQLNFLYIVEIGSALGIYMPEDFGNEPINYCGTVITTTPCDGGTCEYTSIPTSPAYHP